MANSVTETLLNDLGRALAQDNDYPLDGTFLYAEVASQMVEMSIFKDLGDHLLFRLPMNELSDILLELWEAAPTEKRWSAMQYKIEGGRFDASFTYPEEMDPEESAGDRRRRILQQRYANKRVLYPPLT
jgi:hypothetical protein